MALKDLLDKHTIAGLKGAGIAVENAALKVASGLTGGLSNKLLDKISPNYRAVEEEISTELGLDLDTNASKALEFMGEMALIGKISGGATKLVGLSKLAQGSKILPRIATKMASGATTGAGLESLKFMAGNSTPEEIAKEAAIWGGIEGAFGLVGIGASKGLSKMAKDLKTYRKEVNLPKIINNLKDRINMPQSQLDDMLKATTGKKKLEELTLNELSGVASNLSDKARLLEGTQIVSDTYHQMAEGASNALRKTGKIVEDTDFKSFGDKYTEFTRKWVNRLHFRPSVRLDRLLERLDRYSDGMFSKMGDDLGLGYNNAKSAINADVEELSKVMIASGKAKKGITGFSINKDFFKRQPFKSNAKKGFTVNEALNAHLGSQELSYTKDNLNHHLKHLINYNGRTLEQVNEMVSFVNNDKGLKAISDFVGSKYMQRGGNVSEIFSKLSGDALPNIKGYVPVRLKPSKGMSENDGIIDAIYNKLGTASVGKPSVVMQRGEAVGQASEDFIGNYIHNVSKMNNYSHMAESIHKTKSILNNQNLKKSIEGRFGERYYEAIAKNVKSIYDPTYNITNSLLDPALNMIRRNSTTYALGGNLLTALKQPVSFINGMGEVGFNRAMLTVAKHAKNPKALIKFAEGKSSMMKNRSAYREMEEAASKTGLMHSLRDRVDKVAMAHIKAFDKLTASTIWKAKYDQFYAKNAGKFADALLEKKAIDIANKAVSRTQPMASAKDLPLLFKGGELSKLFTMFSNQLNQNYNTITHDIFGKGMAGAISKPEAMMKVLYTAILPSITMSAVATGGNSVMKAIQGEDPKDLLTDMAMYPIQSIPFLGNMISSQVRGYGDMTPMPLKSLSKLTDFGKSKTTSSKTKAGLDAFLALSGTPAIQAKRTLSGLSDLSSGETDDFRRILWSSYALGEKKTKKSNKKSKSPFNIGTLPKIGGLSKLSRL